MYIIRGGSLVRSVLAVSQSTGFKSAQAMSR